MLFRHTDYITLIYISLFRAGSRTHGLDPLAILRALSWLPFTTFDLFSYYTHTHIVLVTNTAFLFRSSAWSVINVNYRVNIFVYALYHDDSLMIPFAETGLSLELLHWSNS